MRPGIKWLSFLLQPFVLGALNFPLVEGCSTIQFVSLGSSAQTEGFLLSWCRNWHPGEDEGISCSSVHQEGYLSFFFPFQWRGEPHIGAEQWAGPPGPGQSRAGSPGHSAHHVLRLKAERCYLTG